MKGTIFKIYSVIYDKLNRRSFKGAQYGAKTADEVAPFGTDANPLQGMDAIYMETDTDDQPVIIGYLNTKQLAAPGEHRIYARKNDTTRDISTYIWLHNNGSIEFAGTADNLVRYQALNTALQQQISLLNGELTKLQAAISSLGGTYVRQPVTLDITQARINEFKTL